ncbi:hypothetical protein C8F04DRAFT_1251562 [Mycena alexandri]|uniref:Uncharacterized protein n=1 Tax=Mycena alexandri TaxID=1745969 RepID=A0AAD6TCX0_9AGAR|nr:hypothetical protein C8F04DRAFT_1251562 [Mycena alexandri]
MSQEEPLTDQQRAAEERDLMRIRMSDPLIDNHVMCQHEARKTPGPSQCAWCRSPLADTTLYRCRDLRCRGGLPACRRCILVVHEEHPAHWMEVWTENRYWVLANLGSLGYVYQEGHDGAPCANPMTKTTTMEMATRFGKTEIICRGCNCA